jgi:hypothetical protein
MKSELGKEKRDNAFFDTYVRFVGRMSIIAATVSAVRYFILSGWGMPFYERLIQFLKLTLVLTLAVTVIAALVAAVHFAYVAMSNKESGRPPDK